MAGAPEIDPADELRVAQQRHRRRMLAALGAAALAVGVFVTLLVTCTGGERLLPPIAKPYLFEVTGPSTARPSYLFGTMHIAYGVGDLPRAVLAAQDRCATTVLESDLEAPPSDAAAPPIPPSRETLRRRLDDAEWAKLSQLTGISEEELEVERTSHLVGSVLSSMLPRVEAMDRGLQRRAREQGKQLVFLETRSLEQVMDERPLLDALRAALQHRGALRAELLRMARSYAGGDDRGCAGAQLADLRSGLNDVWIARIEERVREGDAFIAVGCGHLAGKGSIVELLRGRGFTVRRVDR